MPAVNTPTLTLADSANGTGAVATVAGSTAGSTNTIFAANWLGGFVPQAYASYGSRTGDGAVSLALAVGYWFIYCRSTMAALDGAVSLVGGVRATSGATAIFDQCLDAIVAKIQALSLPSPWTSARVYRLKVPWTRGYITDSVKAAIWVSPLSDQFKQSTNQSDDWGLGCQVTAANVTNMDLTTGLPAHLLCRQQLVNCLLPRAGEAALAGVTEVMNVVIEPGPVLDAGGFQQNFDTGAIVARCFTRQNRTLI
jgi:hypothetical protein